MKKVKQHIPAACKKAGCDGTDSCGKLCDESPDVCKKYRELADTPATPCASTPAPSAEDADFIKSLRETGDRALDKLREAGVWVDEKPAPLGEEAIKVMQAYVDANNGTILSDAYSAVLAHITAQAVRLAEVEAELAKVKSSLEIATEFCESPCGHSSMWAYTEDGGKHIVCLLCIKDRRDAAESILAAAQEVVLKGDSTSIPEGHPLCCALLHDIADLYSSNDASESALAAERERREKMVWLVEALTLTPWDLSLHPYHVAQERLNPHFKDALAELQATRKAALAATEVK